MGTELLCLIGTIAFFVGVFVFIKIIGIFQEDVEANKKAHQYGHEEEPDWLALLLFDAFILGGDDICHKDK